MDCALPARGLLPWPAVQLDSCSDKDHEWTWLDSDQPVPQLPPARYSLEMERSESSESMPLAVPVVRQPHEPPLR